MVRLLLKSGTTKSRITNCFNPTMVRLLRDGFSRYFRNSGGFQSHNGAIAAAFGEWLAELFSGVSIPQWCDCCRLMTRSLLANLRVSIPQWCDCCLTKERAPATKQHSFNPTMVRLLPSPTFEPSEEDLGFNPTMVRLLPIRSRPTLPKQSSFNPTMVRLLLQESCQHPFRRVRFNPTMVRLLPLTSILDQFLSTTFQSHNGAIAA